MRILVTGGAGFIGGHLAERFARDGHSVVVFDNFEPYYDLRIKERNVNRAREAAATSDGSYELVRCDIRNEDTVSDQVADANIVFHQAAQAGVRTSVEQPRKVNDINVSGTVNLLEAARNSETKRVVVASSSSVYGKPQYLPYDEDHPTTPVSPYGVSKLTEEHYARVYNEVYGLPTVSLRYFTVYGPRMRPNMAISNFVSRCMNGDSPVIYGDGTQTRDFTHVDDIVRVNEALLRTTVADGTVMNIGSTDNITIKTLATLIRDRIDPTLEIEYAGRSAADAEHTQADISKAQSLLNYGSSLSIQTGVESFIDWYRDNRNWYEPLVESS
jgi:UDP-glucose 4-epimerase